MKNDTTVYGITYEIGSKEVGNFRQQVIRALSPEETVNVYTHQWGKHMTTFEAAESYLKKRRIPYKKWKMNQITNY